MEFRVLGSLEVVGAEGPLELHGAKERAVLAYLLAHLGRSVSHDEIVDAVWGDRLPSSPCAHSTLASRDFAGSSNPDGQRRPPP